MKLTNKNLGIFAFIALLIIYAEYSTSKFESYTLPSKSILHLNENLFNSYTKQYKIDKDLNRYWGFKKEVLEEDKSEDNNSKTIIQITKKKNQNVLCIDSSCYRLLCIHYNTKEALVTLYNKNLKERVKDYKIKESLEHDIVVKSIRSHSVEFIDLNTSRSWKFKIFDVNQTKYIPKEIEK